MKNHNKELELKDRAFNRTIQALVHDYDRCAPANSPVRQRIYKHVEHGRNGSVAAAPSAKPVKIHFPWGSPSPVLPKDIFEQNADRAKEYWRLFFELMQKQKTNDEFTYDKFEPLKQSMDREVIDITHIKHLKPDEMEAVLWHVGNRCTNCLHLDISYLRNLTPDGVRTLTMGPFGKTVTHLVAKECYSLYDKTMRLIANRLHPLTYCDLTSCINVQDGDMRYLISRSCDTLRYLCLSRAKKLTTQTILAIAGVVTMGQMKTSCRRLQSLDVSHCLRMKTRGFVQLGEAVHSLRFLNMEGCKKLADLAVCALAKGSPNLQVLNLTDCHEVGDVALSALGIHCHKLLSLNLTRCFKVTNRGLTLLSEGTPALQALNLTSVRLVNEHVMLAICKNCTVLSLLVLDRLEANFSLRTLMELKNIMNYAVVASEFYGLRPIDNILYEKMKSQDRFFKDGAATHIQCMLRIGLAHKAVQKKLFDLHNNAACVIGAWLRRCILSKRRVEWAQEYRRRFNASLVINGNARVWLARQRMKRTQIYRDLVKKMFLAATAIQRTWRGIYGRHYDTDCSAAYRSVLQLRELLHQRFIYRSATHIQKIFRGYIGAKKFHAQFEEDLHRIRDFKHATIRVQAYIRMFNAIVLRKRLYAAWYAKWYRENKAAEKLQGRTRIMIAKRVVHEERLRQRIDGMKRHLASAKIASMWKTQRAMRAEDPFEFRKKSLAAAKIQAMYRGSKIKGWKFLKDLPYRRRVFRKRMMETALALGKAENRLYLRGMQGDSASESDEDWEEYFDEEEQKPFWWSLKENRRRYDNPFDVDRAWERSLVGQKARVLNKRDGKWIQAGISQFNPVKCKHKFVYPSMDGGYEWINVRTHHERIMVRYADESTASSDQIWIMIKNLMPKVTKAKSEATEYDYWKMYKRKGPKGKYRR
jgi:hypothetical protein